MLFESREASYRLLSQWDSVSVHTPEFTLFFPPCFLTHSRSRLSPKSLSDVFFEWVAVCKHWSVSPQGIYKCRTSIWWKKALSSGQQSSIASFNLSTKSGHCESRGRNRKNVFFPCFCPASILLCKLKVRYDGTGLISNKIYWRLPACHCVAFLSWK